MTPLTQISTIDLSTDRHAQFLQEYAITRYGKGRMRREQLEALVAGIAPAFKPVTLRMMKPGRGFVGSEEALLALAEVGLRTCNFAELLTLGEVRRGLGAHEVASLKNVYAGGGVYDLYLGVGLHGWGVVLCDYDPGNIWSGDAVFPAVAL